MSTFRCAFCGTLVTPPYPTAKTALCGSCKALLQVPANVQGSTGALLKTDDAVVTPRGFPFIQLVFVIPLAIFILCVVPPLCVTKLWGGAVFGLTFGVALALFGLWRMRQRWTAGRLIWIGCILAFWSYVSFSVTREHLRVIQAFGPVQAEFSGYAPPPTPNTAPPQPIKLKLFPLFLRLRGDRKNPGNAPFLPTYGPEMDLYRRLPAKLKAQTAADARTIVLLDFGWDVITHAGMCTVTLVDRKTRAVVASKILRTPNPAAGVGSSNAHGPQPSNADVIKYLESLPVAVEQAE